MKSVQARRWPDAPCVSTCAQRCRPQRQEGEGLPGSGDAAWKRAGIPLDARFGGNPLNRSRHGSLQAGQGGFFPAAVENPRSWSRWVARVGIDVHAALHVLERKRVKHAWTCWGAVPDQSELALAAKRLARHWRSSRIPPLVDLPRLLSATERLADDKESDEDLRFLLAPGSSLGGARPKAAVRDHDGNLALAKFPRKQDDVSVVL